MFLGVIILLLMYLILLNFCIKYVWVRVIDILESFGVVFFCLLKILLCWMCEC